ncbi:MAG: heparinase II/III family protein, partial [Spirochaetes bacterium]|nr:heparinase II/III family protein [Spirochaetota bacterium]
VGAAALYLYDDPGRKAAVLARILPTLDRFLGSFSADGVCLEGLGYWTYGMGFFTAFADLLSRASSGALDLLDDKRARRAAAFQSAAYLDEGTSLSFADGSSTERFRRGLSAYLTRRFPESRPPSPSLAADFGHDHCGRFCLSLRDLIWSGPRSEAPAGGGESLQRVPAPTWFPDAQWLICPASDHPAATPGSLAFAAKGGHNDEPHNHNDLGSFELVLDGAELLADLGCGEYTREYFNYQRYSIFCNSSFGHSLPIVNGLGQSPGADRRTKDVSAHIEGRKVLLRMDIAGAYDCPGLLSLVRGFEFDGGTRLFLSDSFVFSGGGATIVERFITRDLGALDFGTGSAALLAIRCSRPGLRPVIVEHPHREHDGTETLIRSLDYSFQTAEEHFSIGFEFALKPPK